MRAPVYVVGLGASTPVGRDAWSTAAAVRAGVGGFVEHPYMIDTAGQPMRVALAPWLDIDIQGRPRFEALLYPAIDQALAPLCDVGVPKLRIALALGLPKSRPGLTHGLERELRAGIAATFPRSFAAVGTFAVGHAAGFLGLAAAWARIADGSFDACVVAGVESHVAPETLEWLEANDQLHGAGPFNNAWGFVPGEGAAAVSVVNADSVERQGIEPLARVLSVGTGNEANCIKTPTVCIGDGLTVAFRACLAGLPSGARVTDVFCDLNGEPYRADEFGFASLRTRHAFQSVSDFVASADCWGDVAAASVPLGMLQATIAGKKGYANGAYALVWGSSESGERGAVLLQSDEGR